MQLNIHPIQSKDSQPRQTKSSLSKSNVVPLTDNKQANVAPNITVPEHLTTLYEQLDWHGQGLDALLVSTELAPPTLIGQLMELELLGVISVQGGRYLRV